MCLFPLRLKRSVDNSNDLIDVPCGKCRECLLNKKKELVLKMSLESLSARHVFFITLTLRPEFYDLFYDCTDYATYKIKLLLANIRKQIGPFRYFMTSEYGDHTHRLHYHGIIFYNPLEENENIDYRLRLYSLLKWHWKLYADEIRCYDSGLGALKYVASYTVKQNGVYHFMSSRPPLGIPYLLSHPKILLNSIVNGQIQVNSENYRLPKSYYDYLARNYIRLFGRENQSSDECVRILFEHFDNSVKNTEQSVSYDFNFAKEYTRYMVNSCESENIRTSLVYRQSERKYRVSKQRDVYRLQNGIQGNSKMYEQSTL